MGFRALGYHEKKAGLTLPSLSADHEAPAAIALFSSDPLPRVSLYHPPTTVENPKLAVVSGLPLDSPALLSNLPQTKASSDQLLDANVTTMPELSLAPILPQRPLSPFSPCLSFDFSRFWDWNADEDARGDADEELDFLSREVFTGTKRQFPFTVEADGRVIESLGDNDLMPHVYRILIEGLSQSSLPPLSALSNRHLLYFGPSVQVAKKALREFDSSHPNLLSLAINCAAIYQDDLLLAQNDASVPEWGRVAKSHQGKYHCPVAPDKSNFYRHRLYATRHRDVEVHFTAGVNFLTRGQRISRITLVVHGDLMMVGVEI